MVFRDGVAIGAARIEGLPVVYREDMSIGAAKTEALPVGSIKELSKVLKLCHIFPLFVTKTTKSI